MLFIVNFMTIAFLWSVRKCQNLTMSTSVHLKEKLIHNDSYVDQKALYQYCNFYPPPKGYIIVVRRGKICHLMLMYIMF